MEETIFATKGNLITAKNTLALSRQGYGLLDRKRNILIRELMELIDRAAEIQREISRTFSEAYAALQDANIAMGISRVEMISRAMPVDESITVKSRSVMGVEIPLVEHSPQPNTPPFGFRESSAALDEARVKFMAVKEMSLKLAQIENSAYRLATNIKKTQKRANALKNIMIPRYESITSQIQNALEEKEREEFTRLKVIKKMQGE
ncbi:MAG: V-type ATP synthase subunit D [Clostridia bacterium]